MMTKKTSYQLDAFSPVGHIPLPLGRDEHEKLVRAREFIRMGVTFEQRLDILLENYMSLERYTLDLALRNAIFSGDSPSRLNEGRHNINRHLNNLLSSAKLYIDQTAHALSEVYGRTSSQYQGFIKSTNEEYEKTLAYRTMEALRGYVQHRGLPTHSISFSSIRDNSSSDRSARNRHVVTFGLVPESIRQDGGFKPRVLHELASIVDKKGQIELMPLIREYASRIARIHKSTRMSISSELDTADRFMADLVERVYSLTGHSCISARIWESTAEGMKPCGVVSAEWTQERNFYINKNMHAEYLNGQYVSSL